MRAFFSALLALLSPRADAASPVDCWFRVMPWDVGIATFKSDRYFAIVDLAQADYVVRIGLLRRFVKGGLRWVNLVQSARFERPLRLFDRYCVTTSVVCTDEKHAYVSHRFTSKKGTHAEVLVKVKFKVGSLTVAPQALLGADQQSTKPASVLALDQIGDARQALGAVQP